MERIHIDPGDGRQAAADLSDIALQYLVELALWELALRTDETQFETCLRQAIARRSEHQEEIEDTRAQRDLMRFAAEVMLDIQRLPCIEDEVVDEPGTGMFL